jgi:hypothetical protein
MISWKPDEGVAVMTETFVAIIAMMIALLGAFATAIVITAGSVAWRDWQRERASLNCESGKIARSKGTGLHPKPRF